MFLFLGNHTYSQALNCTCPLTSPTPAISSEFHSKFPAVQRPFLHHSPEVPPTQHIKDEVICCFHTKPDLSSKGKLAMLMISPLVWKIRPSCCWPWPGFCPLPRQVPAKIFYVKCESLPSGTFTGHVVIECIYQRDKTVYSTG